MRRRHLWTLGLFSLNWHRIRNPGRPIKDSTWPPAEKKNQNKLMIKADAKKRRNQPCHVELSTLPLSRDTRYVQLIDQPQTMMHFIKKIPKKQRQRQQPEMTNPKKSLWVRLTQVAGHYVNVNSIWRTTSSEHGTEFALRMGIRGGGVVECGWVRVKCWRISQIQWSAPKHINAWKI